MIDDQMSGLVDELTDHLVGALHHHDLVNRNRPKRFLLPARAGG